MSTSRMSQLLERSKENYENIGMFAIMPIVFAKELHHVMKGDSGPYGITGFIVFFGSAWAAAMTVPAGFAGLALNTVGTAMAIPIVAAADVISPIPDVNSSISLRR